MKTEFREVIDLLKARKLSALFTGATENTLIQFFRYCFVGGGAALVDWGVSLLLFYAVFGQAHAVAANVISFVCGLAVNYVLSRLWIFKTSRAENRVADFVGFAAIGVVGLGITYAVTLVCERLLATHTGAYQIIAKILATGVAFLWNFFARKKLLYSGEKSKKESTEKKDGRGVSRIETVRRICWLVLPVAAVGAVLYYIFIVSLAEFHADFTDTILWADATARSGHLYADSFHYACLLPFGGNLAMLPFVKIFGLTMRAQMWGMTVFFFLFALALLWLLSRLEWKWAEICIGLSAFLALTLSSTKLREIWWGHVIYYSLGIFCLVVGCALLFSIRPGKQNAKRNILWLLLTALFTCIASANGLSAVVIFSVPMFGAVVVDRFFDDQRKLFARENLPAWIEAAVLLFSSLAGVVLGKLLAGDVKQGYADAYSNWEALSKVMEHLQSLPMAWMNLFGVTDLTGKPLASVASVGNLLRIAVGAVVALTPVAAFFLYKKLDRRERVLLWSHVAVTGIVLAGWVFGALSSAQWRLVPPMATAILVTLMVLRRCVPRKDLPGRAAILVSIPLALLCLVNVAGILSKPSDGYLNNLSYQLASGIEEKGYSVGYGTFWNANDLTLISDGRVRTAAVTVTEEGNVIKYAYQTDDAWYEDVPAQKEYFLLLNASELEQVRARDTLIRKAVRQEQVETDYGAYTLLIFDHNIF